MSDDSSSSTVWDAKHNLIGCMSGDRFDVVAGKADVLACSNADGVSFMNFGTGSLIDSI